MSYASRIVWQRVAFVLFVSFLAACARAGELQWSGFALLRGADAEERGALAQEPLVGQLQLGLDWTASRFLRAHVHLVGRGDDRSRRGNAGIAEAYLELNLRREGERLRVRGGALFLPTSRENVDALWENPYTITSSALNSWLGEEFRPIGIDASYFRGRLFAGATLFRGNDTLGALAVARGWTLDDHWALLGEWTPVDAEYFTSVSAENDHRLGWAARGGWNGEHLLVQLTHIDNRGDGLEYHELFNWGTRFEILSAEYTTSDWTIAAESGWGPSFLIPQGQKFTSELEAAYLLVSRRWNRSQATVRVDRFRLDADRDHAITLAYFFTPLPRLRVGAEMAAGDGKTRALIELRYHFAGR